ncbi:MAG: protein phosphatase CheZ [Parvibaculaceae bacterium]|nr:protein phosphatase CheZ [Parvibaculaceae bacterium]
MTAISKKAVPINTDVEFNAIKEAVLDTPRGRWFLEEYARRNRNADTNQLLKAITTLGDSVGATDPANAHLDVLRRELQEMSASIQQTRFEISAIKPQNDDDNRIMAATEELDAIVTATERATSDILSATERLQDIGEKLRESGVDADLCDEIDTHATGIFMACSFQDITGQRTTKVVNVLRYLEQRVNAMIQIWGVVEEATAAASAPDINEHDTRPDAHLLNGPQMDGEGVSQDDIDAMLNGESVPERPKAERAPKPATETASAPAEEEAEPAGEPIDQDDIDALFD